MAFPSITYTLTNGTPNDASQVAQNFSDCINAMKDGTKDFSISALTVGAIFTLSSTISSALTPTTNTFYDIGSSTKGWSSLYLGGTSTFTIKLAAPVLAASYTLTLPSAVPASTLPVVMAATGALSTSLITDSMRATLNYVLSSSSGNFSGSATTETDVTNLSVSITTIGRPVRLVLIPDGTTNTSYLGHLDSAGSGYAILFFERGGSNISKAQLGVSTASAWWRTLPSAMEFVDFPAAGTYTYKVAYLVTAATGGAYVQYCKLLAYEL